MKTCNLPCLGYYDTFSGLVKCVVLEVKRDNEDISDSSTSTHLKIQVTSRSNPSYQFADILEVDGLHVFPRNCYHSTGAMTFRVDDYKWKNE